MLTKEIYKIHYSIVDRGGEWEARPIETNLKDYKKAVKKHLRKYGYAMDLSAKHSFKIDKVFFIGYGNV